MDVHGCSRMLMNVDGTRILELPQFQGVQVPFFSTCLSTSSKYRRGAATTELYTFRRTRPGSQS